MRLHFYTGIAVSVLAADCAVKATSAEGETALTTMSTDMESNFWEDGEPNELSQNELDNESMASPPVKKLTKTVVKKAPTSKVIKKPIKKAVVKKSTPKPVIKKTTKAAPKTALKTPKKPAVTPKKPVKQQPKKPATAQRAKAAAAAKK